MGKKVLDILLLLISGVISFLVSISHPEFGNMEMDALWLPITSFSVSLSTLIIYGVIAIFFKNLYTRRRWLIVSILGIINVVAGVLIYFTNW